MGLWRPGVERFTDKCPRAAFTRVPPLPAEVDLLVVERTLVAMEAGERLGSKSIACMVSINELSDCLPCVLLENTGHLVPPPPVGVVRDVTDVMVRAELPRCPIRSPAFTLFPAFTGRFPKVRVGTTASALGPTHDM